MKPETRDLSFGTGEETRIRTEGSKGSGRIRNPHQTCRPLHPVDHSQARDAAEMTVIAQKG